MYYLNWSYKIPLCFYHKFCFEFEKWLTIMDQNDVDNKLKSHRKKNNIESGFIMFPLFHFFCIINWIFAFPADHGYRWIGVSDLITHWIIKMVRKWACKMSTSINCDSSEIKKNFNHRIVVIECNCDATKKSKKTKIGSLIFIAKNVQYTYIVQWQMTNGQRKKNRS